MDKKLLNEEMDKVTGGCIAQPPTTYDITEINPNEHVDLVEGPQFLGLPLQRSTPTDYDRSLVMAGAKTK